MLMLPTDLQPRGVLLTTTVQPSRTGGISIDSAVWAIHKKKLKLTARAKRRRGKNKRGRTLFDMLELRDYFDIPGCYILITRCEGMLAMVHTVPLVAYVCMRCSILPMTLINRTSYAENHKQSKRKL